MRSRTLHMAGDLADTRIAGLERAGMGVLRHGVVLLGVIEIAIGLAIASRPAAPAVSAIGSAAGALTFLITLSFLISTPGALAPTHPANGFLAKDVVLLGACIATCAEALRAVRARRPGRAQTAVAGAPATRVA